MIASYKKHRIWGSTLLFSTVNISFPVPKNYQVFLGSFVDKSPVNVGYGIINRKDPKGLSVKLRFSCRLNWLIDSFYKEI